jgi:hypothetical protein
VGVSGKSVGEGDVGGGVWEGGGGVGIGGRLYSTEMVYVDLYSDRR